MTYRVLFTYDDGKTVSVVVSEDQLDPFLEEARAGKMSKNPTTNTGFWTSYEQLRHIIVQPVEEQKDDGNDTSKESLSKGAEDSATGKDTT